MSPTINGCRSSIAKAPAATQTASTAATCSNTPSKPMAMFTLVNEERTVAGA